MRTSTKCGSVRGSRLQPSVPSSSLRSLSPIAIARSTSEFDRSSLTYALGLRFQHTRKSSFIDGVGADADYVARHIAARLGMRESVAA
jgi:hypothetical protein